MTRTIEQVIEDLLTRSEYNEGDSELAKDVILTALYRVSTEIPKFGGVRE